MKNVAIVGMTLQVDNPLVVATITITGSPAVKSKATDFIYQDGLTISVTNITVPSVGATIPDPGPYVVPMNSSALKSKAETKLVLLEGDKSDIINATPQIPGPTPSPVSFKVEVLTAGQIKVKAA